MTNYEQLRYFYLSNIACGDVSEADQAPMLAELEKIRASMHKADMDQSLQDKERIPSGSKRKAAT